LSARYSGPLFAPGAVNRIIRESILETEPVGLDALKLRTPVDTGHLRDGALFGARSNPKRYNPKAVKRNTRPLERKGKGWQSRVSKSGYILTYSNAVPYGVFVFGRLKNKGDDRLAAAVNEIRDDFIYSLERQIVTELQ
jgi:hypothetical protein